MTKDPIRLFVGFDQREAAAYHVFCQSVIDSGSVPIAIHPLSPSLLNFDGQRDGTNAFIFSRYLVPSLCDYQGWAIFMDGDMICRRDIASLWNLRDPAKAVLVVKHDYKTKHPRKYVGSSIENDNVDYPRKNWSSVILWNCAHPAHFQLTRESVAQSPPAYLHRFQWLKDEEIGELPHDWNVLVGEDPPSPAHLFHYTLGAPGIRYYADDHASWHWHEALLRSLQCAGEDPVRMVTRAQERIGEL